MTIVIAILHYCQEKSDGGILEEIISKAYNGTRNIKKYELRNDSDKQTW